MAGRIDPCWIAILSLLLAVLRSLAAGFHARRRLILENLALRHQRLVQNARSMTPALRNAELLFYFANRYRSRPHRSSTGNCRVPTPLETSEQGPLVEFTCVGGLHHLHTRQAA